MSTPPTFIVGSVEYLKLRFVADATLADGEAVEIKINGIWKTAAWLGTAGTTRDAQVLVDFTDIAPGPHNIYARLTDTPEHPILDAGRIRVKAEAVS